MLLIECKECEKNILSNVKVCSHSGYKNKKSIWDSMIGFFAIVILFTTFENSFASETKKNTYLSELETNVFNALIQNQVDATIYNAQPIIINENIVVPSLITINEIQSEYEKNQIKANELFKNKILLTTGKIREITTSSTGDAVLKFYIKTNSLLSPSAKIKREHLTWASNLTKQSEVKIICQVEDFMMGNIRLNKCEPFANWMSEQDWAKITLNVFKNNTSQKTDEMMSKVRKIATKVDINNSNCIGSSYDSFDCIGEVARINDLIEEDKQGKSSKNKPVNRVED